MKYLRKKDGKITTRKGFSFGEVILSVFVLSTGLLSVMALMTTNLRESMESRKTIIASGLAQEGVELVRNKADDNVVKSIAQFNGLNDGTYCVGLVAGGGVGYNNACGGNYSLYFRTNGWLFYTHSVGAGSQSTNFKRKVVISDSGGDKKVTGFVWWSGSADAPTPCNTMNKCTYAETLIVSE